MKIRDAKVSDFAIVVNGQMYFTQDLIKIIDEAESLREENKTLEESVSHYQKVIEDNLVGVRCKELEKVIQEQQRELDIRSDKIHNLRNNLKLLKDDCDDLSDCNKAWVAKHKDQQAIIEFQKNDIERLVKLNCKLQQELDAKPKQNLVGDYLKGFIASSAVTNIGNVKVGQTLSGVVGDTNVKLYLLNDDGLHPDDLGFIEDLIYQNH